MRVYDIEVGWQIGHEDLNIHDSPLINSLNSSQQDWVDHGTAVLGEIAGLHNTFGVTGIAYDAELWLLSDMMDSSLIPRPLASAIDIATTNARPGDVIVLPLQALGLVSGETCTCLTRSAMILKPSRSSTGMPIFPPSLLQPPKGSSWLKQ